MIVHKKRHIAKTVTYRLLSTLVGFFIMYFASGSIKLGATFSIIELIYKPIQYYIHERIWYRYIKYGLKDKFKDDDDVEQQLIKSLEKYIEHKN
jgi:uncharacterized membrane protein